MLPTTHSESERLAENADVAQAEGRVDEAELLYAQAAELEAMALKAIPADKIRTRGILAVSVASLWYRARQYDQAEEVARATLLDPSLLSSAREQLHAVLEALPQRGVESTGGAIFTFEPPRRVELVPVPGGGGGTAIPLQEIEPQFVEIFIEHRTLLEYITAKKFRIPAADAELLIQEIFASYAERASRIENTRAWLVGATCNASRHYWRMRAPVATENFIITTEENATTRGLAEQFATQAAIRQALQHLASQDRELLIKYYFEGREMDDIATVASVPAKAITHWIKASVQRVREIYARILLGIDDDRPRSD